MKKENFREFKIVYIITCLEIIRTKGICVGSRCNKCPFDIDNSRNLCGCLTNGYSSIDYPDNKLINSAKQYLSLYGYKPIEV